MSDPLDDLQRIVTRRGTAAQVEAESGGSLEEVRFAYATDTSKLGVYTNGTWTWLGGGGTSASDTNIWRPVMDGSGAVVVDGTGQAVMAYGPA